LVGFFDIIIDDDDSELDSGVLDEVFPCDEAQITEEEEGTNEEEQNQAHTETTADALLALVDLGSECLLVSKVTTDVGEEHF
jgi:dihydroxyacetone kinase DhaKLM complex PTS-EIIA-like component DhaM